MNRFSSSLQLKQKSPVAGAAELAKHTADTLLRDAITTLKAGKPGDRSEDDRKWAIVITELEKVRAILRGFLNV